MPDCGDGLQEMRQSRGFLLLSLLLWISVLGIVAMTVTTRVSRGVQRERQEEARAFELEVHRAVCSYRDFPGGDGRSPGSLNDLLLDARSPVPYRHLRRLHPTMDLDANWIFTQPCPAPDS